MENTIIKSRSNTEDILIDYSRQLTESAIDFLITLNCKKISSMLFSQSGWNI